MPSALGGQTLQGALSGYPVYLGTVDATTTAKTNAEATTPFGSSGELLKGKVLLIQNAGSVDIRLHPVATSTGDVSNTRGAGFGVAISPGERIIIRMGEAYGYMAVITTSSTANVDFWELT